MNLALLRKILLIVIIALISGFVGYKIGTTQVDVAWKNSVPSVEITNRLPLRGPVDFGLFWQVWEELRVKYVDKSKIDNQKMVYGAISGMVAALGDPYTVFLPPQQNKEAKEDLNGNFEGIGAQLDMKDGQIIVLAPLPGSPAERAGIMPGDYIIKVNGEETNKWTLPEAVSKIRGPKGTSVKLETFRTGEEKTKEVTIVRDTIVLKSVDWKVVEATNSATMKKAVYLQLARFGDQTDPQWDIAVKEINGYLATQSANTAGVILDVRNNPGGYLLGAVYTASEFLPNGLVVKQANYDGTVQPYSVNRAGKLLNVPLVVLINQGSASASEILAGSLQVAGRAQLVGMKSFGKGSVQEARDLPDGAGLHVTTAKWLLANDKWIQGEGLIPEVEVDRDPANPALDTQLQRAIQVLNNR